MLERIFNKALTLIFLFASLPIWIICFAAIKITSPGNFIFSQQRIGKGKKLFTIYKFRTMVLNAEKLKPKYRHLNEANPPLFKIKLDPRYTKVGKFLSHIGIDEVPQLINVLKGEMALVGPRPLPQDEAAKIPSKYKSRFSVLPGMCSLAALRGGHDLSFQQWMQLDLEYAKNKSLIFDLFIIFQTIFLIVELIKYKLLELDERQK